MTPKLGGDSMTKEEVRSIVEIAVRETLDYKSCIREKESDARYKNVKLLMRNYRKLKQYQGEIAADVLKVESIGIMKYKTDLIMLHVDRMLNAYKALCLESSLLEQSRRWQSLYLRYIAPKKMKVEEIAESLKIDKRTLYRDLDKAMADVAVLLFGVEAVGTW